MVINAVPLELEIFRKFNISGNFWKFQEILSIAWKL